MTVEKIGEKAKKASEVLSIAGLAERNIAIENIASDIMTYSREILIENQKDIEYMRIGNIPEMLIDRVTLSKSRIEFTSQELLKISEFRDPIGSDDESFTRPNGLRFYKTRVPLGVVGFIYFARPSVTVNAAALCIKSGNVCILQGGRETLHTNLILTKILRNAVTESGLPPDCVQLINETTKDSIMKMINLNNYIDVLIPYVGKNMVESIISHSSVPVIKTGIGNCHIYVDKWADIEMASKIVFNAKCSKPFDGNAVETLLVHKDIAPKFLPHVKTMLDKKRVKIKGDAKTVAILGGGAIPATENDWATEYLDYIIAVKVVSDIDEAIAHVNRYGTGHSEAIVTENYPNAEKFVKLVDAAAVYVNSSTSFTDGYEFGFGADIGISVQKLHTRGPISLSDLTTIKYAVYGMGQTR